jgi:hypothetical protein
MCPGNNLGKRWLAEEYRKDKAKAAALLAALGVTFEELISETLADREALRAWCLEQGDDDAEEITAYLDHAFPLAEAHNRIAGP